MKTTEAPHSAAIFSQYRSAIQSAWEQFQAVAQSEQREDLIRDLEPAINRFGLGLFRLVVMGEIKKGKSSFINALLGQQGIVQVTGDEEPRLGPPELLPTASDVATSTVFKIIYGREKRIKVFFLPDMDTNDRLEPKEIQSGDLPEYGTEAGNKDNKKRVDFIGIEIPHPLLKEGLVIVDTPGVGGLFKAHRDITWRYAPNADAICFVLDSQESPIGRDEISFLKELTQKVTTKIFFLQTKLDGAGLEQQRGFEKRNRELLANELAMAPERLPYFPVSAKRKALADARQESAAEDVAQKKSLKDLDRSGFAPVLKFLSQGLMKQKEKWLAQQTGRLIHAKCADLNRQVRDQIQIAEAGSKEELERLEDQYKGVRQSLEDWERNIYPVEIQKFSDRFNDIKRETEGQLQTELDPHGPLIETIVSELRSVEFDPEQVSALAGQIQDDVLARAADLMGALQQKFNYKALALIDETAGRLASGFRMKDGFDDNIANRPPIHLTPTLNLEFPTFEKVRNTFLGASVGAGLAGVLTLVFPPAGAVAFIATALGAYFGGREGYKMLKGQQRQQVIAALEKRLTEIAFKAHTCARSHFSETAERLQRKARDTFGEAGRRSREELQARLEDVKAASRRTNQEKLAKEKDLKSRQARLAELMKLLASLYPQVEKATKV